VWQAERSGAATLPVPGGRRGEGRSLSPGGLRGGGQAAGPQPEHGDARGEGRVERGSARRKRTTSTDYLLFESAADPGEVTVGDKSLYEKMRLLDQLAEDDRRVIDGVIEAFLTKQKVWQALGREGAV